MVRRDGDFAGRDERTMPLSVLRVDGDGNESPEATRRDDPPHSPAWILGERAVRQLHLLQRNRVEIVLRDDELS